ncbi:MAG TPA: response regulator transcription factor [Saprospiraceae bacterium]|nr:response regulator transcription factor [Saprospiraceae bacterium]
MKIVVADDHPLTLAGTKSFLEKIYQGDIYTAGNGSEVMDIIAGNNIDLAILDINMPLMDGIETLEIIKARYPLTKVILITMHNDIAVYYKCREMGADGYVLKEHAEEELEICIQEVMAGSLFTSKNLRSKAKLDEKHPLAKLSLVERKTLAMIAQQKTSKEIAQVLFLSEKTIEAHRSRIIEKLELPKEKNILMKWAIQNSHLFIK